jgi:DNA-binding transcriptional ArsR family regulator
MNAQKSKVGDSAAVFAALGDPNRLALVRLLCREGPLPTIRLTRAIRFSRQAVTKHLNLLETSGIVGSERVGRDRLWRIEARRLDETRRYLEQISAQWDATIERLRQFVEDNPV